MIAQVDEFREAENSRALKESLDRTQIEQAEYVAENCQNHGKAACNYSPRNPLRSCANCQLIKLP